MFDWSHNGIVYLNRGAAAIMNLEIWKRFLNKQNETFKTGAEKLIKAINSYIEYGNLEKIFECTK